MYIYRPKTMYLNSIDKEEYKNLYAHSFPPCSDITLFQIIHLHFLLSCVELAGWQTWGAEFENFENSHSKVNFSLTCSSLMSVNFLDKLC